MTMFGMVARFGRRKLHTIVSREIIKPSFPTPSYLKTYNLSLLDQISINTFMPLIAFYQNTNTSFHDKTLHLKKSLSQTLTKYYPFAGRFPKFAPAFVDCNDEGVEFIEANVDGTLSHFLQNSQVEDLDQFFPYSQLWSKSERKDQSENMIPLAVQVNHFECGGVAIAVSLSHKVADGSSFFHFFNDWAKMNRLSSNMTRDQEKHKYPIDPVFISFPNININFDGVSLEQPKYHDFVTRTFMFPNTKIKDLRKKIIAMAMESGQMITNPPTKVQVVNWLLYKSAVAAATKNNLGVFKPTTMVYVINLRDKMVEPLPKNIIGNFKIRMDVTTNFESELKPEVFIGELNKQKIQIHSLRNIEAVFNLVTGAAIRDEQRKIDGAYLSSSVCRNDAYEIDFGWGKPVKATVAGNIRKNSFFLMDTPNRDGIEVLVCLETQDMAIFQCDPELLVFC